MALFYLEDRSVADVAETLDMTLGTVKRHLYDGRKTLARRLRVQERRSMTLDARGHGAGRAFRAEIERMETPDRVSIERFERFRAGKRRGQRVGAGLLAAVVAVAGIVFVARAFSGTDRNVPAAQVLPGGRVLFGDRDPVTRLARLGSPFVPTARTSTTSV